MNRRINLARMQRPAHDGDAFSKKHPKMTRSDRAKLFAPFAALSGFEAQIQERRVVTEQPRELSEDELESINERLVALNNRVEAWRVSRRRLDEEPRPIMATILFFRPNPRQKELKKDGERGEIVELSGEVRSIDMVGKRLWIGNIEVPFHYIYELWH